MDDLIAAIEGGSGPDGQKFTAKVAPGPQTVTLKVSMKSKTSTKGVRATLESIAGVMEVVGVSYELGLAIVKGTASVEDMIDDLDSAGYPAELTDPYKVILFFFDFSHSILPICHTPILPIYQRIFYF